MNFNLLSLRVPTKFLQEKNVEKERERKRHFIFHLKRQMQKITSYSLCKGQDASKNLQSY